MIKLVIFDLDGTLIDAYKAIEESLNYTLKRLEYKPVSSSLVHKAVGGGDVNFIKAFVKDEDVEKALDIYRQHHKFSLTAYARTMPRTKEMLNMLKRNNCKLAVATNRPEKFSLILLNHLEIEKYFDLIICAGAVEELKPEPVLLLRILKELKINPDEAFYVGDMVVDVYAGKNAGVRTVAVMSGSSSESELKKAKPFKLISSVAELIELEQINTNLKN
ncbi:HAD family hydrolase [bacterium]|nr:HAD family hydrolase [bacterium]